MGLGVFHSAFLILSVVIASLADAGQVIGFDSEFYSATLGNKRRIWAYLPTGYELGRRRYPVLYLHDGQNLFDSKEAFLGREWGVDETLDATGRELIVIGIESGKDRIFEMTPTSDPRWGRSGGAASYLKMIFEELMPVVDRRLRTRPREVGMGGASLGGLVTVEATLRYPGRLKRAMVMSPTSGWDDGIILERVSSGLKDGGPERLYLDAGMIDDGIDQTRELSGVFVRLGYGADRYWFFEDPAGEHNEVSWGRRFGAALRFLYTSL